MRASTPFVSVASAAPLARAVVVAAAALVAPAALGCSSGGAVTVAPPGDDGGPLDAGAGDDASASNDAAPPDDAAPLDGGADANRATACTAAPFVRFSATVRGVSATGEIAPLAGADVGFSTCPGFVVATDANGAASAQVTQGIAFAPLYSAPGRIGVIGARCPATADAAAVVDLPLSSASGVVPAYSATAPSLAIVLVAKGTAPCDKVDGVTLQVTGHPEAVAKYMSAAWPKDATPSASTSSVGDHVFFTGLAGGLTVRVTGAKTGCTVTTVTDGQTGDFPLVDGLLTIGEARITN